MLFVDNENITDPRINLALEEFLLRHVDSSESILLFYVNEPSVIIGRNQNSGEEIDPDYIEENGIHVVRRLSGGGAVYHDLGNLNFSFITQGKEDLHNFVKFVGPVVDVLQGLGVNAEMQGKSDIAVEGKKVSGHAQYASRGRMFSHGTILFDTSIEHMLRALNPRQADIESKAVQSVRNFVSNIREFLPQDMDIDGLKQALLAGIFGGEVTRFELSAASWEKIRQISAERYQTWAWNYGRSPQFNIKKSGQFAAGKVEVRVDVASGVIKAIMFSGNFSGMRSALELEELLIGVRYQRHALAQALASVDLVPYFGPLTREDLMSLLI